MSRVAVNRTNHVHFRNGQVGRDFGAQVEVLPGITGDETVASNAPDTLLEGQQVAVQHAAREKRQ